MYIYLLTIHMYVFVYGNVWREQRSLADNAVHICIYGGGACYMYVCYICAYTYLYVYMYTQVLTTHMCVFIYGNVWRAQRNLADNAVHICIYGGGHTLYVCMLHICIYKSACIYVYASFDYTHVCFYIWKYMKGAKKLGGWSRPHTHVQGRPHIIFMYVLYMYIHICMYICIRKYLLHMYVFISGSTWRAQRSLVDDVVYIRIYGGGHTLYVCPTYVYTGENTFYMYV